jgi:hypothetical protein
MASVEIISHWPTGTTVEVYLATAWLQSAGRPSGAVQTTAIADAETVVFGGLTAGRAYIAWALGKAVRFTLDPEAPASVAARVIFPGVPSLVSGGVELAVDTPYGIDGAGKPYIDIDNGPTGGEAAMLMIDSEGRFLVVKIQ